MPSAVTWDLRLLGPFEVRRDGALLPAGTPKQRALLAVLALEVGAPVSAERLIGGVWGSDLSPRGVNNVQVQVSALRRALGLDGLLVSRHGGYVLDLPPQSVDVERFAGAVRSGRALLDREEPDQAARTLDAALQLWRGTPLEEFAELRFADEARARLEEQRLTAVQDRLQAHLLLGRHQGVLGELTALVRQWPLDERLRGQLMVALYRSGRQADALRVYAEGRAVLSGELGIDPGPELRRVHEQVLRQDAALDLDPAPRRPPVGSRPEREPSAAPAAGGRRGAPAVPVSAAPMVGRQHEQEQVRGLLAGGSRLVTLVGPGGVGKTRLAAAVLQGLEPSDLPAVWVSLSELTHRDEVLAQVAMALQVRLEPGADTVVALASALRQPCLVVLDNAEQVADAATDLARLLELAPPLQVLVTSQVRLNVYAEQLVHVRPLTLPAADGDAATLLRSEAVQLFYLRASALSGRALPQDVAADVAEICRRLDGLPLAVELAAASCRHRAPRHVLAQLERRLSDLGPAPREAPGRHQSVQAALEWSFTLLTDEERLALVQLSVFPGGFPQSAAAAVLEVPAAQVLPLLDQLVDKSLLVSDGELRFGLLSLVREHAHDALMGHESCEAVHARFTEWCLRFADETAGLQESWTGTGSAPGLTSSLERELASLTLALQWSADEDPHRHARLLGSALPLFFLAGRLDQVERFLTPLPYDDLPPRERHRLYRALAGLTLTHQARPVLAEDHARRSLAALGDETAEQHVWATYNLAATLRCQGRCAEAVERLEAARDVCSRLSVEGAAVLDGELAELHDDLGHARQARRYADAYLASALAEQTSDDVAYAWAQRALLLLDDDPAGAEQAAATSSAVLADRQTMSTPARLDVLHVLVMVQLALGRTGEAASALAECRDGILQMQYHLLLPDHAALVAVRMAHDGEPEAAARLTGAVAAVRRDHRLVPLYRRIRLLEAGASALLREQLGSQRFDALHSEGGTVSRATLAGLVRLLERSSRD